MSAVPSATTSADNLRGRTRMSVNGYNESNQDLLVNFFQYSEYGPDGQRVKYFTWITDLKIVKSSARLLV